MKRIITYIFIALVLIEMGCKKTPTYQGETVDIALLTGNANSGDADAQNRLGICYFTGTGVEQDWDQAKRWLTRSAIQNYTPAEFNLGLLYESQQDYHNALIWYVKSAQKNFADAQYHMSRFYLEGTGVDINLVEAYKWTLLAKRNGCDENDIAANEDDITPRLTDPQLKYVTDMVNKMLPEDVNADANQPKFDVNDPNHIRIIKNTPILQDSNRQTNGNQNQN